MHGWLPTTSSPEDHTSSFPLWLQWKIFFFSGNGIPGRIWVWQNLLYSCHVVMCRHEEIYTTSRNCHCARVALFCCAKIAPEFYLYLRVKIWCGIGWIVIYWQNLPGEFISPVERWLVFWINGKIYPVEFDNKETEADSFGWVPLCYFNDFYFVQNVSARKCSRKYRISVATGNRRICPSIDDLFAVLIWLNIITS